MTDDFGIDLAEDLTDYFTEGANIPAASGTYYVTLYDGTGTELNGSLQNGRVGVPTTDWSEIDATSFDNDAEIDFGEALADITVQELAIKDQDADDATARVLVRAPITDAPQDFASGSRVFLSAGELDVDILE